MARTRFDPASLPPAPNLEHERALWQTGLGLIAGIDEAGRGALAGPVAAGAVILPDIPDLEEILTGLRDSKQMTAKTRTRLAEMIRQIALAYAVGLASAAEIDQIGILPATRLAARRAIEQLSSPPEALLIDYITLPQISLPQTGLTKGDQRSLSIAAAAVLAKTRRDALLVELAAQYPQYGFAAHKGYATSAHRAAIKAHSPCPAHRMTFAPIREDPQMKLI